MRTPCAWAAGIVLLAGLGGAFAAAPDDRTDAPRVSAPVHYDAQMLVMTHAKGVAAFVFGEEIRDGVRYRYRYLPGEGKEESGKGEVFEKYKRSPGSKAGETKVVDDGGQLFLRAGPIEVEWSLGERGKGWIYYCPEEVRVQLAGAKDFDKLDLARFRR